MPKAPFPGAAGMTVHESVCGECWQAWIAEQTKIINELRLSMGNPQSHEVLDRQMRAFLKLPSSPDPA